MRQILLIEDDPSTRKSWEGLIKCLDRKASIHSYPSIESVFNEFGSVGAIETQFDLIIVDIFLSGDETGIQFVSRLSSEAQGRVIISSSTQKAKFEAVRTEFDLHCHYVQKPIEAGVVFLTIISIFSTKNVPLDLASPEVGAGGFVQDQIEQSAAGVHRQPVFLVTGCSSGLGMALAERLEKNPYYRVVLTARAKSLHILKEKFRESDRLMILPLDLTDFDQIQSVTALILKQWGRIDVLINNAGVCFRSVTEQMSVESEMTQMKTNYLGPLALIRGVIPSMRENGRGKIINISSASGIMGMPTMGSYTASKHALEGASEALWFELQPFGINVSVVRPGFINSDGHTHVRSSKKADLAEKLRGPYADFYLFMRPFVTRLMSLAPKTSSGVADEVMRVVHKQNPPLWINATPDAKILSLLKRITPSFLFLRALNWGLKSRSGWGGKHSKAQSERVRPLFRKFHKAPEAKPRDPDLPMAG